MEQYVLAFWSNFVSGGHALHMWRFWRTIPSVLCTIDWAQFQWLYITLEMAWDCYITSMISTRTNWVKHLWFWLGIWQWQRTDCKLRGRLFKTRLDRTICPSPFRRARPPRSGFDNKHVHLPSYECQSHEGKCNWLGTCPHGQVIFQASQTCLLILSNITMENKLCIQIIIVYCYPIMCDHHHAIKPRTV